MQSKLTFGHFLLKKEKLGRTAKQYANAVRTFGRRYFKETGEWILQQPISRLKEFKEKATEYYGDSVKMYHPALTFFTHDRPLRKVRERRPVQWEDFEFAGTGVLYDLLMDSKPIFGSPKVTTHDPRYGMLARKVLVQCLNRTGSQYVFGFLGDSQDEMVKVIDDKRFVGIVERTSQSYRLKLDIIAEKEYEKKTRLFKCSLPRQTRHIIQYWQNQLPSFVFKFDALLLDGNSKLSGVLEFIDSIRKMIDGDMVATDRPVHVFLGYPYSGGRTSKSEPEEDRKRLAARFSKNRLRFEQKSWLTYKSTARTRMHQIYGVLQPA